jgi:poly(hydroxyalkanoate) depolymerase family esterase
VVVGADAGRTTWGRATTKDGSRRFMLYEPPYTSGKRPLVVYLHGCSERPDSTAVASRYNELAKRFGFDVVYPEQPQTANGNHCWNWYIPDHQHRGHGEPGILAEVTRSVMSRRPIDRDRVFVTGVSAGGFMAVVMGATYPEVFAAVGAEAGGQYRGAPCLSVPCAVPPDVSGEWAYEEMGKRARQIPVFALVGDIDGVSPAENTERLIQQWLATNDWADDGTNDGSVDRQPAHSTSVRPDGGYPYEIDRYESRGCVIAERWLVKGMGHAHSGGAVEENYSDPKGPNAALASYRFFMDHPKPGGPLASCR